MLFKRKIIKISAAVLSAAFVGLYAAAGYYSSRLPSAVTVGYGETVSIAGFPELSCSDSPVRAVPAAETPPASEQVTLTLFGTIPVKNIEVRKAQPPVLAVGGCPFGIKLLMEGVMVTGLGDVEGEDGVLSCPAKEAGIQKGDVIQLADGEELTSNDQLQDIISSSEGRAIELSAERDGVRFTAMLKPVRSRRSGSWKGGMWVRDSIAGIGTMTFFDRKTGAFAGLGHPICDSDTGGIVPVQSGEAVPVKITEIKKGVRGIPGELRGKFSFSGSFGSLEDNCTSGIYGVLNEAALSGLSSGCEELTMAYRQEITAGPAEICTVTSGSTPQRYSAEILKVDLAGGSSSKNMVIRITDERLLDAAGGIVQGMSGSPIIQNGKLAGAVTHVFVGDPACGYGIFAENMVQAMDTAA